MASTIGIVFSAVLNESHAITTSTEDCEAVDAEIARVRNYNELSLYVARFCEVLIKQLLYCTAIPERDYKRKSLGGLLSSECRGCRASGQKRHKISWIGSLAHRYHLCLEIEGCLSEHLKIVNRRRNTKAAHSGAVDIEIRTTRESREQMERDTLEIGNELVHMLKHISDIESKINQELERGIRSILISANKDAPDD